MQPSPVREANEASLSHICLACGLCCQGVFYGTIPLKDGEEQLAADLSLPVLKTKEPHAVKQPCLCFVDGHCSIYEERFETCRSYQCMLLRRVKEGSETVDGALSIIRQTKGVLTKVRSIVGEDRSEPIWAVIGSYLRSRKTQGTPEDMKKNAELYLHLKLLSMLSYRYFDHRVQKQWNKNNIPLAPAAMMKEQR